MKEAVDEVLTSAWEMRVGVKNIGDSGENHGFAKRNSPLLDDKKRSFFVSFFSKKERSMRFLTKKCIYVNLFNNSFY
ncbi:hypothetical protein G9H64_08570 [Aquirufa nivalisilvae]|nr:hypothetical protein [Aquirufa nivalisilvae]